MTNKITNQRLIEKIQKAKKCAMDEVDYSDLLEYIYKTFDVTDEQLKVLSTAKIEGLGDR